MRKGLLVPERLEWLTEQMEEKARGQRCGKNLARLRQAVKALEGKLSRCRARLVEVSRAMLPEVEAQTRATREQLDAARKVLHDAESADPVVKKDRELSDARQLETGAFLSLGRQDLFHI